MLNIIKFWGRAKLIATELTLSKLIATKLDLSRIITAVNRSLSRYKLLYRINVGHRLTASIEN